MAFTCLHENTEIKSFTFSPAEWAKLGDRFDGMRMTMPCCDQPAIMVNDNFGGQYFIHGASVDDNESSNISDTCMESSSKLQVELYAKFIISRTLHELGWQVDAEPIIINGANNELLTGVYASKDGNKNVVEVMSTQEAVLKARSGHKKHKMRGYKSVWFNLINLSNSTNHYGEHADNNLLLFDLSLTKGNIFRVFNIHIPRDKPDIFNNDPTEISLTIEDFFKQLMARNLSFLACNDEKHCQGLVGKCFESTKLHKGLLENEPGRWILKVDSKNPVDYILSRNEETVGNWLQEDWLSTIQGWLDDKPCPI